MTPKVQSSRATYLLTLLTNLTLAGINAITGVAIARLLGPEGRGQLAAIQTVPTIVAAIAMVGQTDALVYFAAKNRDRVRDYLATSVLIALAVAVLSAIAAFV